MCGIAGLFRPESTIERSDLEAMARALRHRGPDAWGVWNAGPAGLAHTRLKIVDLSERGAQPMVSRSGQQRIVFNGEIYNHRPLRRDLEARGVPFRSTSDTEVLLEGYAEQGEAYIKKLEGMFAFAIHDAVRGELFLARDRAGEKPLFYLPLPRGGVAFASEIKALRAVVGLDIEPDFSQIAPFLVYGYAPSPGTFYRRVRQLEPGHTLLCRPDQEPLLRRYWAPSFSPAPGAPRFEDAKAELRSRMRDIVRDRLDADVPVGAFLSGGLDSATVVGIATRDLQREVHTFSIGFDDPEVSELGDARLSAQHLGSIHEEFIVTEADIPSMELLVHHHDGPFSDSSAIPTYLVSKMARERVTVAVTGDGGDEVFGGYPRFLGGQLGELVPRWAGRAGGSLAAMMGLASRALGEQTSRAPAARAQRFAAAMARPLEHKMMHWLAPFPPEQVSSLLRPEHRSEALGLALHNDGVFSESVGQTPLARILHHNFRTYLPEDLLVKVDRCSMAVSLETRSPLLDSGLIDFVGSLPDSYKTHGFTTKRLLRETMKDLFAPELLSRPKRGFGVPLARWLGGSLSGKLSEAIRTETAEIYRFLDRQAVERLLWPGQPLDAARAYQAWALWSLEVWLRSLKR